MAYNVAVDFSRHKITLPNVPLPSTFKNSKFSNVCVCENREAQKWAISLEFRYYISHRTKSPRGTSLTILVLPLVFPVAIPCTENFSDSSSSAMDAISTSVISFEVDSDIAVSPISLKRFATYLCPEAKRE